MKATDSEGTGAGGEGGSIAAGGMKLCRAVLSDVLVMLLGVGKSSPKDMLEPDPCG